MLIYFSPVYEGARGRIRQLNLNYGVKGCKIVHTTRIFLLLQFKLNPSVKFSGYETVGNYHHHTWDEEQN